MSSNPPLSLIVPVYNVAPYLPRCLESLATQLSLGFQVVIVDDGATDDCPALLQAFADAHPEVILVRQENGGLSAARNTGLGLATGEYVAFVDSDDWFDSDYYARLVDMCRESRLDMAIGNAIYHFEGRRDDEPIFRDNPPRGVIRGDEFLSYRLNQGRFLHMVWMHVYRRDFIERLQLRFVPRLIHEDIPWTTRVMLAAARVRYDPRPGYYYRQPVRRFSPEVLDRRLQNIIDSYIYIARDLAGIVVNTPDMAPALRGQLRWQAVDEGLAVFHKMKKLSDPGIKRRIAARLFQENHFALLWRHATEFGQKRRIARNFVKSMVASLGAVK